MTMAEIKPRQLESAISDADVRRLRGFFGKRHKGEELSKEETSEMDGIISTYEEEAAEYGLGVEEVSKALMTLWPSNKPGCGCPSCAARKKREEIRNRA